MKKALTFILSLTLSATSALADLNITGINLGISINELQSTLRSEEVVFTEFSDSKVIALKYALGGIKHKTLPSEYTDLQQSTKITVELCDKKVYKISFESLYKESTYGMLVARKEIYQYLESNKAALNKILFNQK